ncbi:hypothetical protein [Hydrogenovibrio marinus]|nr:hypothetical protein [Hydrogenovibrio marinus]
MKIINVMCPKLLDQYSNLDDELSEKIYNARETGEKSLLAYLHRNSIRG